MPRSAAKQRDHQPFKLGNYTIRPDVNEIDSGTATEHVRPKSMAVLLCLAEFPGNVCSRDHIFQRVWGEAELSDEVLTQAIAELRRTLGDDPRHPKVIKTVPRRGYRLVQSMHALEHAAKSAATPVPKLQGLLPYPGLHRGSALTGRHPELTLLVQLLQQSAAGQSNLVLISGEPGIGKTRLAQEALKVAVDNQQLALFGRCSEIQTTTQYLPFVEIVEQCVRIIPAISLRSLLGDTAPDLVRVFPELRRVFSDLPPPTVLPPEQQQRYLFNSFLEFVRKTSEIQPLCLLLDDLQWADEPTLTLLRHMAANLRTAKVLIMGTFRDSEIDQAKPFAQFLEDLITHRLTQRIPVKHLTETDVGDMLESLSGQTVPPDWSNAIFDRTEGNPFFIEELFQHLKEEGKALNRRGEWRPELSLNEIELPESLRWVLNRRLNRHNDATRNVLQIAAVMGRTFSIRPLLGLIGGDELRLTDIIEEVERAWLVFAVATPYQSDAGGLRYSFAHDLIRHALISQVSAIHRQQLHAQIATEFEAVYESHLAEYAADIAYHLYEGGAADRGKLTRYWLLAAQTALEKAAGTEALGFTRRALECVPTVEQQTRAELYFVRSQALRSLNRWEEAVAGWQQALAEFQSVGDGEGIAKCCTELGGTFVWTGDGKAAFDITELGLRALPDPAHTLRVELLSFQALGHATNENLPSAVASLDCARAIAEPLGAPQLLGPLEMSYGLVASFWSQIDDASIHLEKSVKTLRTVRDLWNLALAITTLQCCLVTRGEWQQAEDMDDEVHDVIERAGHNGARIWNGRSKALIRLARTGNVAEFERAEEFGRNIAQQGMPNLLHGTSLSFAQTALLQDRLDEALDWCDKALQQEPVFWRGTAWALRLKISAAHGDAEPLKEFDQHTDVLPKTGQPMSWSACKFVADLVEGLALLEHLDKLAPHYESLKQAFQASGAVFVPALPQMLEKTLGILATGATQWQYAESHFHNALEQAESLPHVLEHAEVLRWYAWMLAQRGYSGDKSRSSRILHQARFEYAKLGLDGLANNESLVAF